MADPVRSQIKGQFDKNVQTNYSDDYFKKCEDNEKLGNNNLLNKTCDLTGNVTVALDNGFYTSVE